MKMDVFCLGLLCFWLVHKEQISCKPSTILNDVGGDRCSTSCEDSCKNYQLLNLANLKTGGNVVAFSNRATKRLDLSEKQKNRLVQFFDLTFASDPSKRDGDLEHLLSLLSMDRLVLFELPHISANCG